MRPLERDPSRDAYRPTRRYMNWTPDGYRWDDGTVPTRDELDREGLEADERFEAAICAGLYDEAEVWAAVAWRLSEQARAAR